MQHGFNTAQTVVVSGCSAGGLSTYLHADYIGKQLPSSVTKFRAIPLSGFFLYHVNTEGKKVYPDQMKVSDMFFVFVPTFMYFVSVPTCMCFVSVPTCMYFVSMWMRLFWFVVWSPVSCVPRVSNWSIFNDRLQYAFQMQNSTGGVDEGCIASKPVDYQWECFFAQENYPFIETPIFVINSAYDSWQVPCILASEPVGQNSSSNGACGAAPGWFFPLLVFMCTKVTTVSRCRFFAWNLSWASLKALNILGS